MTHIYVDADGCPVKQEVCRVAQRYGVSVTFVANARFGIPDYADANLVQVGNGFNEADDWIVEQVRPHEIVITTDIPLAAECLKKGACVLSPKGRLFTEDSIGTALADREVSSQRREYGIITGGPAPFGKKDRSRFLQQLDAAVHASRRAT